MFGTVSVTRRRVSRRVLVACAAAVLVAAPLAACSDDSGSDSSPSSSAAAGDATPGTVSAALDRVAAASEEQTSVRGSLRTETEGEGDVDGTFGFEFSPDGLEAEFTFEQAGEEFRGVITPEALFIGSDALGDANSYLRIPLDESNDQADRYRALVRSFTNGGDLESAVAQWRTFGDLAEDGTETIDGVETTKYVGTFDPSTPPADASQEVKDLYASVAGEGVTSAETTLWIGPDGLPVRVRTVTSGAATSTTVVNYEEWGAEVDVVVPSGDQVLDLPGLGG